jgi:sugar (pentulose or hexulose) kinase
VLIDENYAPVASGWHEWENQYVDGYWTYALDAVGTGVREAYAALAADYTRQTGKPLTAVTAIGISAMMHGYLAFDKGDNLLVPFRTWRNTTTEEAARALSEIFAFNIPQRWSVAHLYQAVLNREPHIKDIAYINTLAGYVHWLLAGERVLGVGDASGMFPTQGLAYERAMAEQFAKLTGFRVAEIFPRILKAGEEAGRLTEAGARFLDPGGTLQAGAVLCPPEGDAGTGMVATNSVAARTGNVSAGTSVFAMFVLEKPLESLHHEIDMVATPHGQPVAMVHGNSCTSDIDAWVRLLGEAAELMGADFETAELYGRLYGKALEGAADGGGLLNYNCFSGEPVAGLDNGCPLFFRRPESAFGLADFMRAQLYSALATLRLGTDILAAEGVGVDNLLGHGGFFKTEKVGQRFMAAALNVPVSVMESAGEGGAWGIALLAAYTAQGEGLTLEEFLTRRVFADSTEYRLLPDEKDVAGFSAFMDNYKKGLTVEKAAAGLMKG